MGGLLFVMGMVENFDNAPAFWMNLRTRYDLEVAEEEIAEKVARDVRPLEKVAG
jgi:plasmid maintenance system antidote protein VapI